MTEQDSVKWRVIIAIVALCALAALVYKQSY